MNTIGFDPNRKPAKKLKQRQDQKTPSITRIIARKNSPQTGKAPVALSRDEFAALVESVKQLPDLEMAQVVALHDRIERNEYRVDSQRLAESIIRLEKSLS